MTSTFEESYGGSGGFAGDASAGDGGDAGEDGGGRAGDGGRPGHTAGAGGASGHGNGGRGGSAGSAGSAGTWGGSAGSAGYEDPGCPPQEPLPHQKECELFDGPSGCGFGLSCFPFVQYPTEPCGQEIYGTLCLPAGTGRQGDPCSGEPCAAAHVCVITGQGTQCAQVCPLTGEDDCPPGLVCGSVDVEGVGVCF